MRVIILDVSNLSEVTLFNEDCACKWNHVAPLGLVGRKVRDSYLWLKEKRTIAECRIYRILQVLRQQCNVCGFISRVQTFEFSGRLVMVTLSGSSTAMALGAESFRKSLTHASRRWGSVVVWETVTPTCHKILLHNSTLLAHAITSSFNHSAYPRTKVVNRLWWETSPPQCSQSEESGVVPVSE